MSRPPIIVGPGAGYLFETGARVFAALAFPLVKEDQERQNAELAWMVQWVRRNKVAEDGTPFSKELLKRIANLDKTWAKAQLRTAFRRLEDRSEAAQATRPMVSEIVGQGPHRLIDGIGKFNFRQISLYLNYGSEEQASLFQERRWRPSRPVLALAVAMDFTALEHKVEKKLGVPLDAIDFFRQVCLKANEFQEKMLSLAGLRLNSEEQLTFEWRD